MDAAMALCPATDMRGRMLKPTLWVFAVLTAQPAWASSDCVPSRHCALQRAQTLALAHLSEAPSSNGSSGGWRDTARLIASLDPRATSQTLVEELLMRADLARHRDVVLDAVAIELAARQPD